MATGIFMKSGNKFEEKIKKYFTVCSRKDTWVQEARVVFLTNRHDKPAPMMKNAWLINEMCRDGDVVLVEAPHCQDSRHFFQTQCIPKQVAIYGWDCKKSDRKILKEKKRIGLLIKKCRREPFVFEEWKTRLQQLINKEGQSLPEEKKQSVLNRLSKQGINDAFGLGKYDLILEILTELESSWRLYIVEKKVTDTFLERQKSLKEALELYKKKRCFVFGGEDHLFLSEELTQLIGLERDFFDSWKESTDIKDAGVRLVRTSLRDGNRPYVTLCGDFYKEALPSRDKNALKQQYIGGRGKLRACQTPLYFMKYFSRYFDQIAFGSAITITMLGASKLGWAISKTQYILGSLIGGVGIAFFTSLNQVESGIQKMSVITGRPAWTLKFYAIFDQFTEKRDSYLAKYMWLIHQKP